MSTQIIIKNSTGSTNPSLSYGELGLCYKDGIEKLFAKNSLNQIFAFNDWDKIFNKPSSFNGYGITGGTLDNITISNYIKISGLTNNFLVRQTPTGLASSIIYDNGSNVAIGYSSTSYKLDVNGSVRVGSSTTNGLTITNGTQSVILTVDSNGALKLDNASSGASFYATGEVSAYGSGTGSTGGGGGSSYNRLDLWGDYSVDKAGYVLSAYLGNDLNNRLSAIEGNGATLIETVGVGNAVTSVSKSGNLITFTKGSTFLTSINSLIQDNLTYSTAGTTYGLSAYQGYVLNRNDITAISASTTALTLTRASGNITTSIPTWNQNTTGSAGSVANSLTLTITGGTTEGTNKYTFNGSVAKTLNFVAGSNVSIVAGSGSMTISATDTIYTHPTQSAISVGGTRHFITSLGVNTLGHVTGATSTAMTKTDIETLLTGTISTHTHQFSDLTSKPTTLSGYGITDALNTSSTSQTKSGALNIGGSLSVTGDIAGVRQQINTVKNNLGTPTVEEMALFHGQFNNKFRFIKPILQEHSTDNITWVTSTRATTDQLGDMVIGEGQGTSFSAMPSNTVGSQDYYRLTWDASQTGYIFLNHLYVYCSTNGNNINFKVEAYHNTNGWGEICNGTINNWPGHVSIRHTSIPFSTSASQYGKIRIVFSRLSASNTNVFSIYGIEWFGGYPAGRRNAEYYDRNKNVTFPANVTASSFVGNASSATKLQTSRTIWGQSFNGEGNVTGRFNLDGLDNSQFSIYNNGTSKEIQTYGGYLSINAGGNNVLIGTRTDSGYKLDVNGTTRILGDLTCSGNLDFNTSANQINSTSAVELALNYAGGGARHTSIFDGQGNFIMRAHYNGNVGIGTSEPQYKLDVNGSVRTGTIIIDEHVSDAGLKINNNSNTYSRIRFFDSDNNVGTIHAFTGNAFLFNNQKCINIDSMGAVSLGHWNEPNVYINTVNGCVGISNTNPQFKLDVNGASRIFGSLHLNNEGWLNLYNGANTSTISLSHNNASSKLDIYNRTLGNWANVEAGFLTCDTITMKNNLSEKFIRSSAWGGAIRLRANSGAATDRGLQLGRVDNNLSFTSFMSFNGDSGNVSINSTIDNGYKLDVNGSGHYASELFLDYGLRISNAGGSGEGISLFAESSTNPNYGLMFARTVYKGTHGAVNGDWATYFTMSPDAGRGWIFTSNAAGTGGNVASISNWGNLTCSGEVTAYSASDIRFKTNIKPIASAIDVINKLNPVSYNWNSVAKELNPLKTDSTEYGLIAQELEKVMPELVHTIYDKYKSIDYVKLVPILIKAVQEQQIKIEKLEKLVKQNRWLS